MRRAVMILAFLGTALFGAASVVSFLYPLLVERARRKRWRVGRARAPRLGKRFASADKN